MKCRFFGSIGKCSKCAVLTVTQKNLLGRIPKLGGYLTADPHSKDFSILGSILGPPVLRNYQLLWTLVHVAARHLSAQDVKTNLIMILAIAQPLMPCLHKPHKHLSYLQLELKPFCSQCSRQN